MLISCVEPSPIPSSTLAIPPVGAVPLVLSASDHVAKALTLPLMASVQSPAGIIIPAFATEAAEKTAPATVLYYTLLVYVSKKNLKSF